MKTKKIIICLLIILILNVVLIQPTHAFSEIKKQAEGFISSDGTSNSNYTVDDQQVWDVNNTIYNILTVIAVIVAIIVGAFLGIQFIFGSVEGKAKVSETLIPYIIGCIVAFGAFTIWRLAIKTGESIEQTSLKSNLYQEQRIV